LVEPDASLPNRVAFLDHVDQRNRLTLVERPDHLPGRDEDTAFGRKVRFDEAGIVRAVVARPTRDEVDDWRSELMRRAKRAIVGLVDRPVAVGV
jgi:hypothetical protein